MRAFVAVEVPREEGEAPPDAPSHLTLRFFGELPPHLLPAVTAAMDRVAGATVPFPLELAGVGAFPDPRAPRVVWVGATTGRAELVGLAARLSEELAVRGIPPEPRPFVPHVTLFRVRGPRDRERAFRALADGPERRYGATTVRELLLKESVLGHAGAVHRAVHRSPFGAAAPGP